jgi:hypothetical protein
MAWLPAVLAGIPLLLTRLGQVYQKRMLPSGLDLNTPVSFSLPACYLLAGLAVLVVNYRRLTDVNERRRVRVLVVGTVMGWVAIGTFLTLIVAGTGQSLAPYAPYYTPALFFLFLAFPVSFAYAILRHRVFDLGLILRRGLQYALARRVLLTAVPALAILLLADLLAHGQQPLLEILRERGWIYVVLGGAATAAYVQRRRWLEALDRRFFRERYDAQRLLREVVEEIREARSFEQVAPRAVQRVEAALHPEFAALFVREPGDGFYRCAAVAPAGCTLPAWPAGSKLMGLMRLLGKPLEVPQTGSGWLGEQLPSEDTELLRRARIELIVPIAISADHAEALLALGAKRSEEPYAHEDRNLLVAVAASLALLLDKPSPPPAERSDMFEECPQCGTCFDSGATHCSREGKRLVPVVLPRVLAGRYLLQQRVGRGGMGTVYAASDTSLERRVAVKVIRGDLVGSAEAAERFRREARVAASFAHPNVVTIHDFGIAAGTRAFLVMELLEGSTLRERLQRESRFPAAPAMFILRQVCAALDAAHRRQLVHRDLKPENIFLLRGEAGEAAKVLDFGIAKFLPTATFAPTADTAPGAVLGTPRYMSPEQWRGEEAHPAWDLWALAVVGYEMVTGAFPFSGRSPAEWFEAASSARIAPVTAHLADAPAQWQSFFQRAFCARMDLRPQTAEAFLAELEAAFT